MPVNHNSNDAQPSTVELQRRRTQIQRGLARAGRAAIAALAVVLLLATFAGWEAERARSSAQAAREAIVDRQEQLWQSQLYEARSHRLAGGVGQRTKTIEVIGRATAFRASVDLRNEAIAALVMPDIGSNIWWRPAQENPMGLAAFTPDLAYFVPVDDSGHIAVYRAADRQVEAEFDGLGSHTVHTEFSPDGRLLAVQHLNGMVGVWEWRSKHLAFEVRSKARVTRLPGFDFSSDGREFWTVDSSERIAHFALPDGQRLEPKVPNARGVILRLDRTGRRLLAGEPRRISAWDVPSGEPLGEWTISADAWCLAWHPDGEHFVIGTYQGGLRLGEIGQTHLDTLETSLGTVYTATSFSVDGSLVLAGDWGNSFGVWDLATRNLVLQTHDFSFQQLSSDGARVAFRHGGGGSYGVSAFLNPVGVRRFRVPARLVGQANSAAWHPSGQWVLMSHSGGWSLWEAKTGRLVAERQGEFCWTAQFLMDGTGFLTGGRSGPLLWPVEFVNGEPKVGEPRRLLPSNSGANERASLSPDQNHFAAVGQGGAFIGSLSGDTPPMVIPGAAGNHFIEFSPDGEWLRVSRHGGVTVDVYGARTGALVTNLPTGAGGACFVPGRAELLAAGPKEFTLWRVGTWELLRRIPRQEGLLPDDCVGFWPSGGPILANEADKALSLWDLPEHRQIARFILPEGSGAWGCVFDPSGRFMAATSSHPYLRLWDFPSLRGELAHLGLDWPDAQPAHGFRPEQPSSGRPGTEAGLGQPPPATAWLAEFPAWAIFGAMLLALAFGGYMLAYQRRLFLAYGDLDRLAATQARELQDTHTALLHGEKMQALGTLAAGIAHDFNNLLSVVRLSSELIEEQTQPTGNSRDNFNAIHHAVQRGKGIVNSMLGYARDDGQTGPFAPGDLISEAVALLSKPFLSGLLLKVEIEPRLPTVHGHRGRAEQMLLNLIVNASEAMNGRGALTLGARAVSAANACLLLPRTADAYVELFVQDTGPGIAPEALPRIFDPFFTTKAQGARHGTGLGLSMLYTMATEDGVGVAVETECGKGATFRLVLPVTEPVGTTRPLPADPQPPQRGESHE